MRKRRSKGRERPNERFVHVRARVHAPRRDTTRPERVEPRAASSRVVARANPRALEDRSRRARALPAVRSIAARPNSERPAMSSVTRSGALSSAEEGSPLLERPLARETPRGASRKVWIAALALVALVSCGVAAAATTTTWGRGRVGDISSSSAAAPDLGRLGVNPDEGVNPVYSSIHSLDHKGRFSASSTKTKSAVDAALLAVNAHHPRAGDKKVRFPYTGPRTTASAW